MLGKTTPWGPSQHQEELAPGIVFHSTASHGGIELDDAHARKINYDDNFLQSRKWWEEDCDWAIPYFVFQGEIKAAGKFQDRMLDAAVKTIEHMHPTFKM